MHAKDALEIEPARFVRYKSNVRTGERETEANDESTFSNYASTPVFPKTATDVIRIAAGIEQSPFFPYRRSTRTFLTHLFSAVKTGFADGETEEKVVTRCCRRVMLSQSVFRSDSFAKDVAFVRSILNFTTYTAKSYARNLLR